MTVDITEGPEAEAALAASEERFREFLADIDLGALMLDASGKVVFINDHLLQVLGRTREEMLGRDWIDMAVPERERMGLRSAIDAVIASGLPLGSREDGVVTRAGDEHRLAWTSVLQRDAAGRVIGIASIAHDVTELHRVAAERTLLSAAVEQTADAVIVTDPAANIVFVNPAFERASGYSRSEVIGKNPRVFRAGTWDPDSIEDMWATLDRGTARSGEHESHRRDGSEYTNAVTITPVFDSLGALSAYIWVQRDVSHVREVEADLVLEGAVRALLAEAIAAAASSSSLEEAAQAVCDGLASLPGIHVVDLVGFLGDDDAVVIAHRGPDRSSVPGDHLLEARARQLQERAATGPWGERPALDHGERDANGGMRASGIQAVAYGPIRHGDDVIGVLIVGTQDHRYGAVVADKMPELVGFGASTNTLLVERLQARRREYSLRRGFDAMLAAAAFRTVFQPIVELESGAIIGYEALTRFESGERPDIVFVDAWSVGMGAELELATLEAAIATARGLPAGSWLDINVSPRLLDTTDRLRTLLRSADRPVVVEITEHERIDDYVAVRAATAALGNDVRLAVDDAGVGIANFGHIIELHPDFVKLDISLVRRVNADLGRQALVVAMRHFARTAGCRLVAEGVETAEEARTLKQLGVEFGQGYWFGRPEPVEEWAGVRAWAEAS